MRKRRRWNARAPLSRVKSPKRIANGNSCAGHFELEARALDDEPSRSGGFDIAQGIYSSDPITSNSYSHWRQFAITLSGRLPYCSKISFQRSIQRISDIMTIGLWHFCLHVSSVSNAMLWTRANLKPHLQYNCILNQVQIRYRVFQGSWKFWHPP